MRGQLALHLRQPLAGRYDRIGASLPQLICGFSYNHLPIRVYALHVCITPGRMRALVSVHLARDLVLDLPASPAITGSVLIIGCLLPAEVGIRYDPNQLTQITFPEWYFTSLYAFIRTKGLQPFIAGAIIPGVFVLIFTVVPFFDKGRKIAMIDRPFWVALGVAALGQIAIVTVWGFRASNPFQPLLNEGQLLIDPVLFAGSLLIATSLSYGFVYAFVRWRRAKLDAVRAAKKPIPYRKVTPYLLTKGEVYALLGGLLLL